MKKSILALSLLLIPMAACADVSVEWANPEGFKDPYYSSMKDAKSRQTILDDLKQFIVEQASQYLKEGETLTLQVTDVDLAGEFQPWSKEPNVRVIKSPYFAHMSFAFKLTGADGKVIKEDDSVSLTNMLLTPPALADRDTLEPYLRDSIRSWMSTNLHR